MCVCHWLKWIRFITVPTASRRCLDHSSCSITIWERECNGANNIKRQYGIAQENINMQVNLFATTNMFLHASTQIFVELWLRQGALLGIGFGDEHISPNAHGMPSVEL